MINSTSNLFRYSIGGTKRMAPDPRESLFKKFPPDPLAFYIWWKSLVVILIIVEIEYVLFILGFP